MNGLIPAIVQDASTGAVLMLGYMNREALAATESTAASPSGAEARAACGPRARPRATSSRFAASAWIAITMPC